MPNTNKKPKQHNASARRTTGKPRQRRRAVPAESAARGVRLDRVRVVLVRPEQPFNIGQAARAMLNMGLTRMVLVDAPRSYRGSQARQGAAGAAWKVLKHAVAVPDINTALEGTFHSIAMTSGRGRGNILPGLLSAEMPDFADASLEGDVALVFGCERDGLSNEEVSACHTFARLAVSPEHPSMNLGQAVLLATSAVFGYEREAEEIPGPFAVSGGAADGRRVSSYAPATHEAITSLYRHLWDVVEKTRFPSKQNPELLGQGVRRLINRSRPTVWEVQLMRGFLTHLERVLDRPETLEARYEIGADDPPDKPEG